MGLETINIRIHEELGQICSDEYWHEFHLMGLVEGHYGCKYRIA